MLTTHPLLVPRLRKCWSCTCCHPDAPLWGVTGPLYLYTYPVMSEENKRAKCRTVCHLQRVEGVQAFRKVFESLQSKLTLKIIPKVSLTKYYLVKWLAKILTNKKRCWKCELNPVTNRSLYTPAARLLGTLVCPHLLITCADYLSSKTMWHIFVIRPHDTQLDRHTCLSTNTAVVPALRNVTTLLLVNNCSAFT
jgi:hypothetical protein